MTNYEQLKKKICEAESCNRESLYNGYCNLHYQRVKRYGDVNFVKSKRGENRSKDPIYKVYCGIKRRCYNKNEKAYRYYGGAGIVVDESWLGSVGFTNFKRDMGERPIGYSIDRIDGTKSYSAENCRWASRVTQNNNRRNIPKYEIDGVVKTKSEWCEHYGIKKRTVTDRVSSGWDIIKAITTPLKPTTPKRPIRRTN